MQIFDETVKWRKSRLFLLFCKSLLRKDNEHLNTVIKRLKSPNTTLAEKNYLKKNTDDMNIIHNNNKTVKSICANTCRLTLVIELSRSAHNFSFIPVLSELLCPCSSLFSLAVSLETSVQKVQYKEDCAGNRF